MQQPSNVQATNRERGKHRRACQPCSRRKVRCDREIVQPCSNCVRRGHPKRCDLGSEAYSRAQPHHAGERSKAESSTRRQSGKLFSRSQGGLQHRPQFSSPSASTLGASQQDISLASIDGASPGSQDGRGNRVNGPAPASHIGEPAMATFIRHQVNSTGMTLTDSLSAMLGLQNSREAGYPLLDLGSSTDQWEQLEPKLPRPVEIWRCLPFFREGPQIINPSITDYAAFDAKVCTYLEDYAAGKLKDQALDNDKSKARELFAWIGFILAALAAGSQCSPVKCPLRKQTTQDFIFRAFHCLRMSNFLLRPTLQVVQTYSLIVFVIQNESEADAAWALLGTVMRLAQCIGLHLHPSAENTSPETSYISVITWRNLVWQDCIISLSYGRPANVTEVPPQIPDDDSTTNYCARLWYLSNLTLFALGPRSTVLENREQLQESIQRIGRLQMTNRNARDADVTTKTRIQYHAFRLYSSFVVSFLCQQRLRTLQRQNHDIAEQAEVSIKLIDALKDSITSFMSLYTTSLLPMRIWSMKHIALCSAFLLSFRCNLKQSPALLNAVEALIEAFTSELQDGPEDTHGGLSMPHARALGVLREMCSRGLPQPAQEASVPDLPTGPSAPVITSEADFEGILARDASLQSIEMPTMKTSNPVVDQSGFLWDDEFFSLLTGNANISSNDVLDGFRTDTWNQEWDAQLNIFIDRNLSA